MKFPFDCISEFIFVETEIEKSDIILIPGGSHPQLVVKAAELYHRGLAPYILPSGSANPRLPCHDSEWEFLRETALSNGVPESAILKEDKAQNTFDNARLSLEVMKRNNIPPNKVILVCKAYHSRRALLTYQSVFPANTVFYTAPVRDKRGMSKDNWFTDNTYISIVMREIVKIGKYFEDKIPRWFEDYTACGGYQDLPANKERINDK